VEGFLFIQLIGMSPRLRFSAAMLASQGAGTGDFPKDKERAFGEGVASRAFGHQGNNHDGTKEKAAQGIPATPNGSVYTHILLREGHPASDALGFL